MSSLRLIHPHTLLITAPSLRIPLLTLVFTLALMIGGEVIARNESIQSPLPFLSLGSGTIEVDVKLTKLNKLVKTSGRIDCFFLGSSSSGFSVDPESFNRTYKRVTGKDSVCFNFSIQGARISATRKIAQFLVQEYHPTLIILGVNHIQFYDTGLISNDMPWIDHKLGSLSLPGWLIEHWHTLRYVQTLRYYLDAEARGVIGSYDIMSPLGFYRETKIANLPVQRGSTAYPYYQITADDLEEFSKLIQLNTSDTKLIVIEEVTNPVYLPYLLGEGESDYETRYIQPLRQQASLQGATFWRTRSLFSAIPLEGWRDHLHTNTLGATIFSEWLGQRVAESIMLGSLPPIHH